MIHQDLGLWGVGSWGASLSRFSCSTFMVLQLAHCKMGIRGVISSQVIVGAQAENVYVKALVYLLYI